MSGYASFEKNRQDVLSLLARVAKELSDLDCGERASQLAETRSRLHSDTFRLFVVGEFKRGKSTFINALLGDNILPAKVAPCTAIITHVRYGEKPSARLHYKPEAQKEPLAIDVKELRKYIIEEDDSDSGQPESAIRSSPFDHLEVFYPLAFCKNNVEVIDSPGLNEAESRSKTTKSAFKHADAFIIVLACDQFLSKSELHFITEELKDFDLGHAFVVCNRYDQVESDDDLQDLKKRAKKYLAPRLGDSDKRIYWVSALKGLRGKKLGETDSLKASNLVPLERDLESFLTSDRAKVKLLNPIRTLESAIQSCAFDVIPSRERMFKQSLDELERRFVEQQPNLEKVKDKRDRILQGIERRKQAAIREAQAAYQNFVNDIVLKAKTRVNEVDVGIWDSLVSRGDTKKRVADELQAWYVEQSQEWTSTSLAPLLTTHAEELSGDLKDSLENFALSLDRIKSGLAPAGAEEQQDGDDVSALSRVVGAVGGFVVGGVASGIEGAALGVKGMAKGLATNVVIATGLLLAGVSAPVTIALMAAFGIGKLVFSSGSMADELRAKVAEKLIESIRANTPKMLVQLADQIAEEFDGIREKVDAATRIALDEVEGQVRAILDEKRRTKQGEAEMQRRLATSRSTLLQLDADLKHARASIMGV